MMDIEDYKKLFKDKISRGLQYRVNSKVKMEDVITSRLFDTGRIGKVNISQDTPIITYFIYEDGIFYEITYHKNILYEFNDNILYENPKFKVDRDYVHNDSLLNIKIKFIYKNIGLTDRYYVISLDNYRRDYTKDNILLLGEI